MHYDHNENWNDITIEYCRHCSNDKEDEIVTYIENIDVTFHPTFTFNYDLYHLDFYFNFMLDDCTYREDYYTYKNNISLQDMVNFLAIDVLCIYPPLDRSLYTCKTWKDVQRNIIQDDDVRKQINVINMYMENDITYNLCNDVVTDEEITYALHHEYHERLEQYNEDMILCNNILSLPNEQYYLVETDEHTLYSYIERYHDAYFFNPNDNEVSKLEIKEEFNEEVKYGFSLNDVFNLPHFIEVDGIEYVRVDVRRLNATYLFSTGRLLCDVLRVMN